MNKSSKKPGPGRPSGRDADRVRNALLSAARKLFLSYEFKAVSVRKIAETAGVNGAMVNYYFGGKKGLYLAMVDSIFSPLLAEFENMDPERQISIEDFVRIYTRVMSKNPWWPNFIIREVLFGEGELREVIVGKFGSKLAPQLMGLIMQKQIKGEFRLDMNPQLTLVSLLGLTIFPFLARPLVERILNYRIDETSEDDLVQHTTDLFLHGAMGDSGHGQ